MCLLTLSAVRRSSQTNTADYGQRWVTHTDIYAPFRDPVNRAEANQSLEALQHLFHQVQVCVLRKSILADCFFSNNLAVSVWSVNATRVTDVYDNNSMK